MIRRVQDFKFDENVSSQFDDMLHRSVPFYDEMLRRSCELCAEFYQDAKLIYDLGCSTGLMAHALSKALPDIDFQYVGIDTSPPMLKRASENNAKDTRISFREANILDTQFDNASIFISNFTLQFLRPLQRQPLLKALYDSLPKRGALILGEKVLEDNSDISRLFVDLYYDFKKRNGYSELEISRKREQLENVLIPYRLDENIDMLKDAGFSNVNLAFKWYNFALFLAVK